MIKAQRERKQNTEHIYPVPKSELFFTYKALKKFNWVTSKEFMLRHQHIWSMSTWENQVQFHISQNLLNTQKFYWI